MARSYCVACSRGIKWEWSFGLASGFLGSATRWHLGILVLRGGRRGTNSGAIIEWEQGVEIQRYGIVIRVEEMARKYRDKYSDQVGESKFYAWGTLLVS